MVGVWRKAMSISSCAPPGRYCSILSTGTGIATPPFWTPGGGDGDGEAKGFGFGVGVGNEFGTGVGPGVAGGGGPRVGILAETGVETIHAPQTPPPIKDNLIEFTCRVFFTPFSP